MFWVNVLRNMNWEVKVRVLFIEINSRERSFLVLCCLFGFLFFLKEEGILKKVG